MDPSSQFSVRVRCAGIDLASPVVLAAGTAGVLDETSDILDLARIGALVTKSITPLPREGNAVWRVLPERTGMLNAIGLANPGIERFVQDIAPRAASMKCPVIASAAGFCIADYVCVVEGFTDCPALAAIELNVSCPNVHGGTEFGSDRGLLAELVQAATAAARGKVIIVKLPPLAVAAPTSIVDLARVAIESGAGALTISNTMPAMAIDIHRRVPALANVTGGLSGPAIHAIVTRLIHLVYRGVAREAGVPIIGLGGVMNWRDAAEFILAGASAVGIGTASFVDIKRPLQIARGLERWARSQGVSSIAELTGALRL
jgi:dihydroorotate dehydrogenase (NAD+) catalytic subunit